MAKLVTALSPTSETVLLTAILLCPLKRKGRSSMVGEHKTPNLGPEGKVGKGRDKKNVSGRKRLGIMSDKFEKVTKEHIRNGLEIWSLT